MWDSMKVSLRRFLRERRYGISFFFFLGVNIFILRQNTAYYEQGTTPINTLYDTMQLGLLWLIYFSFLAYEYASQLKNLSGEDAVSAIPGGALKLIFAQGITLLTALLISLFLYIGWLIWFYTRFSLNFTGFLSHGLLASVRYLFMPGLVAVLIGIGLKDASRPLAYGLIVLVGLLSSSAVSQLFSSSSIGTVSIGDVLDWFQFTVPDTTWWPDAIYGIPMEGSRWLIVLLWISLLLGIILFRHRRNSAQIVHYSALALGLCSLIAAAFFLSRGSQYVLIKDLRPNGVAAAEPLYRETASAPNTNAFSDPEFQVIQYEMYLDIHETLKANMNVYIDNPNLDEYTFTLHHNYHLDTVLDDQGVLVDFIREGDFVTLQPSSATQYFSFQYQGGNNIKYYANQQAIALPGYHAYYPKPGHLDLWDESSISMHVISDLPLSQFQVHVNTSKQVYSNLQETAHNEFSGQAQALTLYAGLLQSVHNEGNQYIYGPLSGQKAQLDIPKITALWEDLKRITGVKKDLSFENKVIFYQALTLKNVYSNNETVAVFDDHVLLLDLYPSPELIAGYYLMQDLPAYEETVRLRELFLNKLFAVESERKVEKPVYEDLEFIKEYENNTSFTGMDLWEKYSLATSVLIDDLYIYKINTLGRDRMIKELYDYLKDPDLSIHYVDALYDLGETE